MIPALPIATAYRLIAEPPTETRMRTAARQPRETRRRFFRRGA